MATKVRVSIRFEEEPPHACEVSTNPADCGNNIHTFIQGLCGQINKTYEKSYILLLEPDNIIFDVSTIETGDRLVIIPRTKLVEIMRAEEEKRKNQLFFKLLNAPA